MLTTNDFNVGCQLWMFVQNMFWFNILCFEPLINNCAVVIIAHLGQATCLQQYTHFVFGPHHVQRKQDLPEYACILQSSRHDDSHSARVQPLKGHRLQNRRCKDHVRTCGHTRPHRSCQKAVLVNQNDDARLTLQRQCQEHVCAPCLHAATDIPQQNVIPHVAFALFSSWPGYER